MGLAAYGVVDPELYELMLSLIAVDGLGLAAARPNDDAARIMRRLLAKARVPGAPAETVANVAATGQRVFEDLVRALLCALHARAPQDRLAYTYIEVKERYVTDLEARAMKWARARRVS